MQGDAGSNASRYASSANHPGKVFFFSPPTGLMAEHPLRVTTRVPLSSGLARARRSLDPGSQRSPPHSVRVLAESLGCLGSNLICTEVTLILPGERVCPALSPSLDAGLGPRRIAWKAPPFPAHSHCLLSGAASNARAPSFPRLALRPHPALVAFSLDSLRRGPHLHLSSFLLLPNWPPSKIIHGSAESFQLLADLGVSAARPFLRQPALYTSIHFFPFFLEAFICRL